MKKTNTNLSSVLNKHFNPDKKKFNKTQSDFFKILDEFISFIKTTNETEFINTFENSSNIIYKEIYKSFINNEFTFDELFNFVILKENFCILALNKHLKEEPDYYGTSDYSFYLKTNNEYYFIIDKLAEGGNSIVFRVHSYKSNQTLCLKYITRNVGKSFEREVEVLLKIKHKNIMTMIDYNDKQYFSDNMYPSDNNKDKKTPEEIASKRKVQFYVSKLYNYSLKGYLKERSEEKSKIKFNINDFLKFVNGVNDGLSFLNKKGYLHCDIKADNILFDTLDNPIIADFGCVLGVDENIDSSTQDKFGNHTNASPEQRNYEFSKFWKFHKTDIYSAGTVYFQVLSGTSFEGTHSKKMAGARSIAYLMTILEKMTQHLPPDRADFNQINNLLEYFEDIWNLSLKKIDIINGYKDFIDFDIEVNYCNVIKDGMNSTGMSANTKDSLKMFYKRTNLDKNLDMITVFVKPIKKLKNNYYTSKIIIKSFLISKNKNVDIFFYNLNETIFVYLKHEDGSHIFYPINLHELDSYKREDLAINRFYYQDDLTNLLINDLNPFFALIETNLGNKFYIFGNLNCPIKTKSMFFIDYNKYYPMPDKHVSMIRQILKKKIK
jgi:serine/threonine protein kinase